MGHTLRWLLPAHSSSVTVRLYHTNPRHGPPPPGPVFDQLTQLMGSRMVDLSAMSDRQAAERIAADRVHVLINLHGYRRSEVAHFGRFSEGLLRAYA